jgi:hypothetical protein
MLLLYNVINHPENRHFYGINHQKRGGLWLFYPHYIPWSYISKPRYQSRGPHQTCSNGEWPSLVDESARESRIKKDPEVHHLKESELMDRHFLCLCLEPAIHIKTEGFFSRQICRLSSCQLGCTSKNAPNSDGHPRWIQGVAPWVKMLAMGWTSKTGRWMFIWGHVVSDNIIGPSSYGTKTWTQSTASETVAINNGQWVNGDDLVKWVS